MATTDPTQLTAQLIQALQGLVKSVRDSLGDGKLSLSEAYEILRELVQDAVALAETFAVLPGEAKRAAVTEVAIQVAEILIGKLALPPVVSVLLRPLIRAAVPVVVDLLLELWVSRLKLAK